MPKRVRNIKVTVDAVEPAVIEKDISLDYESTTTAMESMEDVEKVVTDQKTTSEKTKIVVDGDNGNDDKSFDPVGDLDIFALDDDTDALDQDLPESFGNKREKKLEESVTFNVIMKQEKSAEAELQRPALPYLKNEGKRMYKNPFLAEMDPKELDSEEKRVARAKRFGTQGTKEDFSDQDDLINKMYTEMEIPNPTKPDRTKVWSVTQIRYFGEFRPEFVEWVNDNQCNVVFKQLKTAAKAMLFISKPLERIQPARKLSSEMEAAEKDVKGDEEKETKEGGENVEEIDDVVIEEIPDDPDQSTSHDKTAGDGENMVIESNDGIVDEGVVKESKTQQRRSHIRILPDEDGVVEDEADGGIEVTDEAVKVDVTKHTVPPGIWRVATKHCKNASLLLLRFASSNDVKQKDSQYKSDYYVREGNPNHRGQKGLISCGKRHYNQALDDLIQEDNRIDDLRDKLGGRRLLKGRRRLAQHPEEDMAAGIRYRDIVQKDDDEDDEEWTEHDDRAMNYYDDLLNTKKRQEQQASIEEELAAAKPLQRRPRDGFNDGMRADIEPDRRDGSNHFRSDRSFGGHDDRDSGMSQRLNSDFGNNDNLDSDYDDYRDPPDDGSRQTRRRRRSRDDSQNSKSIRSRLGYDRGGRYQSLSSRRRREQDRSSWHRRHEGGRPRSRRESSVDENDFVYEEIEEDDEPIIKRTTSTRDRRVPDSMISCSENDSDNPTDDPSYSSGGMSERENDDTDDGESDENRKKVKKAYKCHECQQRFSKKKQLHNHKTYHHSPKLWYCEDCDKTFRWQNKWRAHQKRHEGYQCPESECADLDPFSTFVLLRKHRAVAHPKRHNCSRCPKHFDTRADLRRHEKVHDREVDCPRGCEMKVNPKRMASHISKFHGADIPGSSGLNLAEMDKESLFKCDKCLSSFTSSRYLTKHKQRIHEKKKAESEPKWHFCTEEGCNQKFRQPSKLQTHINFHQGHRPFKCPVVTVYGGKVWGICSRVCCCLYVFSCDRKFCGREGLTKHVRKSHCTTLEAILDSAMVASNNKDASSSSSSVSPTKPQLS